METNAANNWVVLPPQSQRGNPERLEKHFKAIPHENGHVTILNAAAYQILGMKRDSIGHTYIWKVGANSPKNSIDRKCQFTFEEVNDSPGEVTLILDIFT